jgi:hypothetical protein
MSTHGNYPVLTPWCRHQPAINPNTAISAITRSVSDADFRLDQYKSPLNCFPCLTSLPRAGPHAGKLSLSLIILVLNSNPCISCSILCITIQNVILLQIVASIIRASKVRLERALHVSLSPCYLGIWGHSYYNTITNKFSFCFSINAGNLVKSGHHTEGEKPEITWKNIEDKIQNSFLNPYIDA